MPVFTYKGVTEQTDNKRMKIKNEDFDKVLNKLTASTRSPRGRFSAESSWQLLANRLRKRRSIRRLYLRVASSAAIVLLCIASWAAYEALSPTPKHPRPAQAEASPAATRQQTVFRFDQQPLEEIARQLSETFRTVIRIDGDSLKLYRMTGTFKADEGLLPILDLLKEAGNFNYQQTNDTITITKIN